MSELKLNPEQLKAVRHGEGDLEVIKEKMLATIERIRKREFPPVLEERKCRSCDYRLLCRGELTATER